MGLERYEQLTEGTETEAPDLSELIEEFQREVVDKRREAAELSCGALKTYLRTVISFDGLGTPTGEFSLVNGLDETAGPFPLEVVRTDLECADAAPAP